jgi:hypothetical protein
MAGIIADGGGDFRVVVESVVEFIVLLVVDSVTIGCPNEKLTNNCNPINSNIFLIIGIPINNLGPLFISCTFSSNLL